jgi:hypothetical protein
MSVTIITALYGDDYDHFLPGWEQAIKQLSPQADAVLIGTDRERETEHQTIIAALPEGKRWRSPFYWNLCAQQATTDWVWVLDIDDRFLPNAMSILDQRDCDIVQVGYIEQENRTTYLPPRISNDDIIFRDHCAFVCGSPIRRDWLLANPYPDTAYTDWAQWRQSARRGARFEYADRPAYEYRKDFANSMSGWADIDHRNRQEALTF